MSHDATNWAIKQRGLPPTTKLVLWHLADRHNPDFGCFPRQDNLAADVEISRSSLNTHLAKLEDLGLIHRVARIDPKTKRQISTRYILGCEPDFAQYAAKPCPEFGHGTESEPMSEPCPDFGHGAVSRNSAEPCPENGESRVQNLDTNLVREPLREPVRRAVARRTGVGSENLGFDREPENPSIGAEALGAAFERFWAEFPEPVERDAARKAFGKVIASGEAGAEDLINAAAAYAASGQVERGFVMKPANWLARGSWREPARPAEAGHEPAPCAAPVEVDLDAQAAFWVEPVKAGRSYAASGIKPALARHMVDAGLVTTSELRRVGVAL